MKLFISIRPIETILKSATLESNEKKTVPIRFLFHFKNQDNFRSDFVFEKLSFFVVTKYLSRILSSARSSRSSDSSVVNKIEKQKQEHWNQNFVWIPALLRNVSKKIFDAREYRVGERKIHKQSEAHTTSCVSKMFLGAQCHQPRTSAERYKIIKRFTRKVL